MARTVYWRLSGAPREEIEDVVSSLWARLLDADCARLRSFGGRNGARFPTWLATVARNAADDHLRRKRPAPVPLDSAWPGQAPKPSLAELLADGSPGPLERLVARETRREILLSVKALPRIYRRAIYARFYRHLGTRETAAVLGIEEDTVYVRVARAFAKLRKELSRRGLDCACPPKAAASARPKPHRHFSGKRIVRLMETLGREAARELCRADMSEFCPPCRKTFLSVALMWQAFDQRINSRTLSKAKPRQSTASPEPRN